MRKKILIEKISAISDRLSVLEEKEKQWLTLAAAFEGRLNLIQAKQTEINQKYDKLLQEIQEYLNNFDILKKENTAFTTWLRGLGSRVVKIEEKIK